MSSSPSALRGSPQPAASSPLDCILSASSETLVATSLERSQQAACSVSPCRDILPGSSVRAVRERERPPSIGQSPRSQPAGGLLSFTRNIFGTGRERQEARVPLVTSEGSIAREAWAAIGKDSPKRSRFRTLLQLQELMKNKTMQVSTLEGIFHETVDMLDEPDTREPTMKAFIDMTKTQYRQLGLALRHSFFEKIRSIGCTTMTVEWLVVLSNNGINLNGFEKDMDHLLTDWSRLTLEDKAHPQTVQVMGLIQNMIVHNASYISVAALKSILRACSLRVCRYTDTSTQSCVLVMGAAVKYSELPMCELHPIIASICQLMAMDDVDGENVDGEAIRREAWNVARGLLISNLGHRTRKFLHLILQRNLSFEKDSKKYDIRTLHRVLRGAIFCLANANWGNQLIENVRSSPAAVLPSMQIAMRADATVCRDVLQSMRRLFAKFGRDMQEMAWRSVFRVLEEAEFYCKRKKAYATECFPVLHQLIDICEQFYRDGQLMCPPHLLFDLIERIADKRSDESILNLIDYKNSLIDLYSDKWIPNLRELVLKYLRPDQSYTRREKALKVLHEFYVSHRCFVESELVTKVILQILPAAQRELNSKIQYHMLNILFDVAKTVSLRGESFEQTLKLIRKLFNEGIPGADENRERRPSRPRLPSSASNAMRENVLMREEMEAQRERERKEREEKAREERDKQTPGLPAATSTTTFENSSAAFPFNDNLEIMAQQIAEVMEERWSQLGGVHLNMLVETLVDHANKQYLAGLTGEDGGDVRVRVFAAVLAIQCCPVTHRIRRYAPYDDEPTVNAHVFRKGAPRPKGTGELGFGQIAHAASAALREDTWWPTIRIVLQCLHRVLECTFFVRTAGEEILDRLFTAILGLHSRVLNKLLQVSEQELCKYLPPVLTSLLNYGLRSDRQKETCRIIVECVKMKTDSNEAVIGCALAIQMVPDAMAGFAHSLLRCLIGWQPSGHRALPIIELLSDASEIPQFYKLFQEEQFRMVADILAPYTSVRKYNTYVVSCVHRILMRWFSKVPKEMRNEIARYYERKIRDAPATVAQQQTQNGMNRQPSGDGRHMAGSAFSAGGGVPETPPPMGGAPCRTAEDHVQQKILDELYAALQQFFRIGKIEPFPMGCRDPKGFEEIDMEHYAIGDSILTVRTLVEKKRLNHEDDEVFTEKSRTSSIAQCGPTAVPNDERRRYASAVQPQRRATVSKPIHPKALDDLSLTTQRQRTSSVVSASIVPVVTFTQLTVRHMYGRTSWLMRGMEELPEDFMAHRMLPVPHTSLLLHFANLPGSVKLGSKKSPEMMSTLLRNLDRVSGIELHAVGLIYMGSGQRNEGEAAILANQYGCPRYEAFVRSLGTAQSTEDEPGGLQSDKNGEYTYVYMDETSSIVFLVATLMPRLQNDPKCNNKKKLIGNNVVCIVWNQSGKPYQMGAFCKEFIHVMIEVVPVDSQNLLIEVHARAEIACWLAMRRALVHHSAAPAIIRKLCIRSKLAVDVYRSMQDPKQLPYISSAVERLRKIQKLKQM